MGETGKWQPKIIGFLCNWCSYAGSDMAGTSRMHHDITMRAIRVMCSGRVEPGFIIKAFEEGADGVIIAGCHIPSDCHYTSGNFKALNRYQTFQPLLEELGIEKERLQLHWISASEGQKFAEVVNRFTHTIRELGPLNSEAIRAECRSKRDEGDLKECLVIRKSQEFAACEAASSDMVDLDKRKAWDFEPQRMEPSIIYDGNKCIRCGSCVEACRVQGIEALTMDQEEGVILDETRCVRCGQCVLNCPLSFPDKTISYIKEWLQCRLCPLSRPVGAITEQDDTARVISAIADPDKYVVAQVAPSIRTTIGEEFGLEPGKVLVEQLYSALRGAGFDRVWDTNFSADLTIMEEGSELIDRLRQGGTLPQFTSCCPAWVRFVELYYPQLMPNLSTTKSPQQMLGAVAKTYAAEKLGIPPEKMFVVSIMPCTAKKFECSRDEMTDASKYWEARGGPKDAYPDVDAVLTTRECAKLLKLSNIDLADIQGSNADGLLGKYTGAGAIFGRTGGVMTAALRTAHEMIIGKEISDMDLEEFSEYKGIKTLTVDVGPMKIKTAVVFGLNNARMICEDILEGGQFSKYHFIEVMTCPGGCVGGGGQIISTNAEKAGARSAGLNSHDRDLSLRKSHENPDIKAIYDGFLKKPCSELAHKLLHVSID